MADAELAASSGHYEEARAILQSATRLHQRASEAWVALANVHEKLQDWDGAYNAWTSLSALAKTREARDLANASALRVADEWAIARLTQAEIMFEAHDYPQALGLLADAVDPMPSTRMVDRLQIRYFEVLAAWFGREVCERATAHGWKMVAVATFIGGSKVDSYSVRNRIYSALTSEAMVGSKIASVSATGILALQESRLDLLPTQDWNTITGCAADAIVFGTIGRQLQGYILDVKEQQVAPVLAADVFGDIPAFPSDAQAWTRLPHKSLTSRGLRVEVWTDKPSYTINSEVVLYLRSNSDCYITLLDLQTSGGLYVLFPNLYQQENFIRGGRIYRVPSLSAPFSINANGPVGVEGVKAIAAVKPLASFEQADNQPFVAARSPRTQDELCLRVLSETSNLTTDEWDIAECTFEIRE